MKYTDKWASQQYDRLLAYCIKRGIHTKESGTDCLIEEIETLSAEVRSLKHDIEHYLLMLEESGVDSSSARASECIDGDECEFWDLVSTQQSVLQDRTDSEHTQNIGESTDNQSLSTETTIASDDNLEKTGANSRLDDGYTNSPSDDARPREFWMYCKGQMWETKDYPTMPNVDKSDFIKVREVLASDDAQQSPLHASAPDGCKCSDCTIDQEACPRCYRFWWQERHPNTLLVDSDNTQQDSLPKNYLDYCPNCGGPADNGNDRCLPPNPYFCTKCEGLDPVALDDTQQDFNAPCPYCEKGNV